MIKEKKEFKPTPKSRESSAIVVLQPGCPGWPKMVVYDDKKKASKFFRKTIPQTESVKPIHVNTPFQRSITRAVTSKSTVLESFPVESQKIVVDEKELMLCPSETTPKLSVPSVDYDTSYSLREKVENLKYDSRLKSLMKSTNTKNIFAKKTTILRQCPQCQVLYNTSHTCIDENSILARNFS